MYFGANTLLFVILIIILIYLISKISNILRLNYILTTFIMIFCVILIGFVYQYLYFIKINAVSKNGEDYKIKKAFLNYSFNDDTSADVEHKLLFEENNNSSL